MLLGWAGQGEGHSSMANFGGNFQLIYHNQHIEP